MMNIRWKLVAGGFAGLVGLGLLTLRYGGELAAPFLDSPPRDSQVTTTPPADSATAALASSDTPSAASGFGPFGIDRTTYTFQVQPDTGAEKSPRAARRVQALDGNGRVVYDENLFLRRDSTRAEDWLEFTPMLLEDASGVARGFNFTYAWVPNAPNSGVAFNVVAPRGDSLIVLTPTIVGYYGRLSDLPAGSVPGSQRLLPGNQMTIESGRGWFTALINLRIDFNCVPRSAGCVRIDLPDSVAGLARFALKTGPRQLPDSAVAIDVYSAPHSGTVDRIGILPGQQAEILGGAGKVYFDRTPSLYLSADDEWIEIRINGKRGWITGPEAFMAIGLQQGG